MGVPPPPPPRIQPTKRASKNTVRTGVFIGHGGRYLTDQLMYHLI